MNIIQAVHSPKVFRSLFAKVETWKSREAFLAAVFDLPVTAAPDLELLKKCTGLDAPPAGRAARRESNR